MILSFNRQFVLKIIRGEKIHTIREDRGKRWHAGRKIHFATGARTKLYFQFGEGSCRAVQLIQLDPEKGRILIYLDTWRELKKEHHAEFFRNDGFNSAEAFWTWFDRPFHGVIIHWTDFKYTDEHVQPI